MIDVLSLQTSETGPRSRSKPSGRKAEAIAAVLALPTGIAAQGTELIAMQTAPPSWSVAAIRRWRWTPRSCEINDVSCSEVLALWLRFTTSTPPYWCSVKSASTEPLSGPWKPTIMTAPISSSSVSPPGPVSADGEAEGGLPTDTVDEGDGSAPCVELEQAHSRRRAAAAACFNDTVSQRTGWQLGYA